MVGSNAYLQLWKQFFVLSPEVCRHIIRIKVVVNPGVLTTTRTFKGGVLLYEVEGERVPRTDVVEGKLEAFLVGLMCG